MTVLVEHYWREISTGLAEHGIPVRHVVLHADQATLRRRIEGHAQGSSPFRLSYLEAYAQAADSWLHREADVVDTTRLTAAETALEVVQTVERGTPALTEVLVRGPGGDRAAG